MADPRRPKTLNEAKADLEIALQQLCTEIIDKLTPIVQRLSDLFRRMT